MSYTQISRKVVNIAKPHRCFMCNTISEPPSKMTYITSIFDGDFQATYSCSVCEDFMTAEKWKDYDNEIRDEEIWEDPDYKQFREQYLQSLGLAPNKNNDDGK